jgi:hypothetical protein
VLDEALNLERLHEQRMTKTSQFEDNAEPFVIKRK